MIEDCLETKIHRLAELIKTYQGLHDWDKRVSAWIDQFDNKKVILDETYYILSQTYYDRSKIEVFLRKVIECMKRKYGTGLDNVTFWNGQIKGNSQQTFLRILAELTKEETIHIDTVQRPHMVYLDDGLYTNGRATEDFTKLLKAPGGIETIDACFLFSFSYGKRKFIEKTKNIYGKDITVGEALSFHNDKYIPSYLDEYTYFPPDVLWPHVMMGNEEAITKYKRALNNPRFLFRNDQDKGLFTSFENRQIVEKEFLIKGIALAEHSIEKHIYPLGVDSIQSFGFGSFCATEYNISNTCPLVLWWNVGDWHPLMPRKIGDGPCAF